MGPLEAAAAPRTRGRGEGFDRADGDREQDPEAGGGDGGGGSEGGGEGHAPGAWGDGAQDAVVEAHADREANPASDEADDWGDVGGKLVVLVAQGEPDDRAEHQEGVAGADEMGEAERGAEAAQGRPVEDGDGEGEEREGEGGAHAQRGPTAWGGAAVCSQRVASGRVATRAWVTA